MWHIQLFSQALKLALYDNLIFYFLAPKVRLNEKKKCTNLFVDSIYINVPDKLFPPIVSRVLYLWHMCNNIIRILTFEPLLARSIDIYIACVLINCFEI